MTRLVEEMRLLAESAAFDTDRLNYFTCPECGKDKKLMLARTEDGGLFWRCLSAQCPTHGYIRTSMLNPMERKPKARATRPYVPTHPLTAGERATLLRYVIGLRGLELAHYVDGTEQVRREAGLSVAYAVRGPLGELRGHVVRHYGANVNPRYKSDTFPYVATGPLLGWTGNMADGTVIIVEDMASALALRHTGARGVALLGTHLNAEGAAEIARERPLRVLVCLDNDATDNALRLRQSHGATFGCPAFVVPLTTTDLKDRAPDALQHWYATLENIR